MKWHVRGYFLPTNYVQALYERLKSLPQGDRSVDEFTEKFHYLVARNDIRVDEDQLVAHYLNGLRPPVQEALAVHPLWNVTEAY